MDKDLVPNMVQADSGWFWGTVEEVGRHCFSYVPAEHFPVISLRDDAFGQALCNEAALTFLSDLKDNLVHAVQITALRFQWQGRRCDSLVRRELHRVQEQGTPAKGFDRCSHFINSFLGGNMADE
jgi:hypothetical protein